ncbi:MAG TPA: hypothetical protein VKK79_10025 [Candidatus Lokiarchaeia archaeon]|nr:hypothetical protein [Candidatus Lokiarchaeia archaeon]
MVDFRFIQLVDYTLGASVILITLATLCIQFARRKFRYMLTMILTWAFSMAMTSFATIHVWLNPNPSTITDLWGFLETIFAILMGFATIVLVDSLSRESVEPIKLSLYSVYIGTSLYVSFTNPVLGQDFFIYGIQAITGFIWFYYCARIYRNAPKSLRFYGGLNLFGSTSVFAAIVLGVSGISTIFPGIEWVAISGGYLLTTIAFIKRDQLAFLLPFRVLRLSVVHLDSGIPMFNYTWPSGRDLIDENLFSGLMHGLRLIIRESILGGEFRDINLDLASIIINRVKDYPVMAVLVTKKTSRVLRQALSTFTRRFIEKYRNAISNPSNSSQFEDATVLVQDCFNFLPDFD